MATEKDASAGPIKGIPLRESLQPNVTPREFRNNIKNLAPTSTNAGLPPTKPHNMMSSDLPKPAAQATTPSTPASPKE